MIKKLSVLCFICAIASAANAQDEVHPFISDKFSIQVGMFFPQKDFDLSVDGTVASASQEFDFEAATGISETDDIFELEFKWRFGEKWSMRAQYYQAERSKRAVLKQDITWRDEGILAGSDVTARANFDLYRLFFGRSFDRRSNVDAGVGIGVHWLEIGASIEPNVITTFGDVSAASVSGPLPNIGGWYYYSPSPRWFIGGRLDWLEASVDKYDGGIWNLSAGVNFQMTDHLGFGVKYQVFELGVNVDNDGWNGRAELTYDGPYVYFSGNW